MVRLTNIDVKGFKGIQSTSIEPGQLNIITGRNNAGKTSLLEAIAVLSDPTTLEDFGDRATSVINKQREETSLHGKYWREQLSLKQYDAEGNPSDPLTKSVKIRQATDKEVYEIAIQKFNQNIPKETAQVSLFPLHRGDLHLRQDKRSNNQSDEAALAKILNETLSDSLLSIPEEDIIEVLSDDVLAVKVQDQQLYLFSSTEGYREIILQIVDSATETLVDDNRIISEASKRESKSQAIHRLIRSVLSPKRRKRAQLFGGSPTTVSGIHYLDEIPTKAGEIDFEDNPIRVNKVENYLQKHDIAGPLEDFSFTDLVFQKDEEPPYDVPFEFMGDGFKTIVGILWELFDESNDGDVLLIEEPEQHMHPGYIEQLTRVLIQISKEEKLQLFITTHNTDFLESFISKEVENQHGEYLQKEFQLFQLTEPINRSLSYEDAKEDMNNLNLDLRGP
ncbi:AAA family ATPase [Salinarchaeum sp. Harcht-Bsk1]|uniref:AAA family ATPase n=1 Tax=Salinarchaeum sp. Harcht-Bsk1 TaxID=1333523 RepID=UPI0009DB995F|nr:AAA family ATPase [Salinarchaeum sp. Harcht-Bsk1]